MNSLPRLAHLPAAGPTPLWSRANPRSLVADQVPRQPRPEPRHRHLKIRFPRTGGAASLPGTMPQSDLPAKPLSPSPERAPASDREFGPTRWTTIIDPARHGDEPTRQAAMEQLLSQYYNPIYAYVFSRLLPPFRTPERAKDLTQGFIEQCLRLEFLKNVDRTKYRFRDFIRRCIKNYLRDQHDKWLTHEGRELLLLDETDEDGGRLFDPPDPGRPVYSALDRAWALEILRRAMAALRQECTEARRAQLFNALEGHLGWAPDAGSLDEVAARLGMKEGAVKVAMLRLRQRLGELIRQEVRQTVGTAEDWEEELKYLIEILAEGNA